LKKARLSENWEPGDSWTGHEAQFLGVPLGEPLPMFYIGIDQHAKQLTLSLRNQDGVVTLARQVSTEPKRFDQFFAKLRE